MRLSATWSLVVVSCLRLSLLVVRGGTCDCPMCCQLASSQLGSQRLSRWRCVAFFSAGWVVPSTCSNCRASSDLLACSFGWLNMSSRHLNNTAMSRECTALFLALWALALLHRRRLQCGIAAAARWSIRRADGRTRRRTASTRGTALCASRVFHCVVTAISRSTSVHFGAESLNAVCTLATSRSTSGNFSDQSCNKCAMLRSVAQRMCFSVIQWPTRLKVQRTFAPESVALLQLQRTIACA